MSEVRGSGILWTILLLLAPCLLSTCLHAQYGGGTGEPNDPYLICTPEQMNAIGADPNDWDKHFKLMADLDLSEYTDRQFNLIGHYGAWNDPNQRAFTGVFDGNGHVVANFTYRSTGANGIGLFAYVADPNAQIKNLGLVNPSLAAGEGEYVGSLVGLLRAGTVISCCVEGGSVQGGYMVGGLTGCCRGTITTSYTTCSVSGTKGVGGLTGASGIPLGRGRFPEVKFGILVQCYSAGAVKGKTEVGGLCGLRWTGDIFSCFWDVETSGQKTTSGGGTGKTTAEMEDPRTFIATGWDFFGPSDGLSDVWAAGPASRYPVLWWQVPEKQWASLPTFSGGSGTLRDPYLVSSAEQLNSIGYHPRFMESHFQLTSDINLLDVDYVMIGRVIPFAGTFDGNGRTISHFACTSAGLHHVGVFGHVHGHDARIFNLGIVDPNIHVGTGGTAGALIGRLGQGTVSDCHVEGGTVTGDFDSGGLVGCNDYGSVIDCDSTAAVVGKYDTGGLVGNNYNGRITNCRATGTVSGGSDCGGLAGYNAHGTLSNCRAAGTISGSSFTGGLLGDNFGVVTTCRVEGSNISGSEGAGGLAGGSDGTIMNCQVRATVIARAAAGGLVGRSESGAIMNSRAEGNVTADWYAGGLLGYAYAGTIKGCSSATAVQGGSCSGGLIGYSLSASTVNSHAVGSVAGKSSVGGLIGASNGSILNCYACGRTSSSGEIGGGLVGYLLGYGGAGSIDASFWDVQATGQTVSAAGAGMSSTQMKTANTFLSVGWDFVGETANGAEDIWWIEEGKDYPRLAWELENESDNSGGP